MQPAHLHLLLNHWPIIGTFIALGLFLASLLVDSDDLKQASLVLFAFLALLALPVYMSGNAANEAIKDLPDVSMDLIQSHLGAAFLSLIFMEITGLVAMFGLWRYSRSGNSKIGKGTLSLVLLLAIVTVALMSITGNTGGEIRHSEIVSAGEPASAVGAVGSRVLKATQYFVLDYSMWVWPAMEDLHYFGLILLVGAIGILNLRIVGFLKKMPVGPLHRFMPWGIAGFAINVITGMGFFIGMAPSYVVNYIFQLKILAVLLAGTTLLLFYFTSAFRGWARLGPGEDAPPLAKVIAASQIILWILILILGRYIPVGEIP